MRLTMQGSHRAGPEATDAVEERCNVGLVSRNSKNWPS